MAPKKTKKAKPEHQDEGGTAVPFPEKITRKEELHRVFVPVEAALLPELNATLCEALGKKELLQLQCKDVVAGFRADIKELDEKIKETRVKCQKGDTIDVMCERITDTDAGIVKWIRLDTREEVERRNLTEADSQLTLGEAPAGEEAASGEDGEDGEGGPLGLGELVD